MAATTINIAETMSVTTKPLTMSKPVLIQAIMAAQTSRLPVGSPFMATKRLWREWANSQVWTADSVRIRSGIEAFLRELEAPIVLTYAAMPGEADVESIDGAGELLLTRTPDVGGLTVHRADSPMETHRWGYRQPVEDAARVESAKIDVVLVPGALFDRRGGRLGHGRGYYDRLLATCRPAVIRVGVTTAGAIVERLPTEPHDIAMTHLATETGVRPVSG